MDVALRDPDPEREKLFRAILGSRRLGEMPFASPVRRVLVCQRCGELCRRARGGTRVGRTLVCDECRPLAARTGRGLESLVDEIRQRRYILWMYGSTQQLTAIAAWGSGMPVRPPWAPAWAPDEAVHPDRRLR